MRLKVPAGMRSPALMVIRNSLTGGLTRVCDRRSGLLGVQGPETRELLERWIALHGLEGLHRIVLVAGLELRDAERQARIGLILHVALAQTLGQLVVRLVVLAVAEIRAADRDVLVTVRRRVGFLLELRQTRLVGGGALLGALQQALSAILAALVGE